jgi:sulfur-carrier protein
VIRVVLPQHLRTLAGTGKEVHVSVAGEPTIGLVLDSLETIYPMLRGTLRDPHTKKRRAFIRFFACEEDWSNESPDLPLPEEVAVGKEPLHVVGAMAGG